MKRVIFNRNCNIEINDPFKDGFVNVYILQRIKLSGETVNQLYIWDSEDKPPYFTIKEDGYYVLTTIKVSTDPADTYYYKDGSFYRTIYEVTIQELIDKSENVSQLKYFLMCKLMLCYVNICELIFESKSFCTDNLQNLSYKRDLLTSAIATIEYLCDIDNYEEAERLLNCITTCNGLCETSNCGCNG